MARTKYWHYLKHFMLIRCCCFIECKIPWRVTCLLDMEFSLQSVVSFETSRRWGHETCSLSLNSRHPNIYHVVYKAWYLLCGRDSKAFSTKSGIESLDSNEDNSNVFLENEKLYAYLFVWRPEIDIFRKDMWYAHILSRIERHISSTLG